MVCLYDGSTAGKSALFGPRSVVCKDDLHTGGEALITSIQRAPIITMVEVISLIGRSRRQDRR